MSPYPPISSLEANLYYHGLYSRPVLVARSGTNPWKPPAGPPGYLPRKLLRTVGNHPLTEIWKDKIALQMDKILQSKEIKWTSTDVTRIGTVGEAIAPVVIWIGVQPDTLPWELGYTVAMECKELLVANQILDVEVEIRESVVTRYSGPKLLKPAALDDPTAELREPLTSTLGLSISRTRSEWAEGTGGFYLRDKIRESKLYLVTARHVVFPSGPDHKVIERKRSGQPYDHIALFSSTAFINYLGQITTAITKKEMVWEFREGVVEALRTSQGKDGGEATSKLASNETLLQEVSQAIVAMKTLYNNVVKNWDNLHDRIIGHLRFSPPLQYGTGSAGYTQDYALIELDQSKIDAATFTGNAIDLGTKITPDDFTCRMFPNATNRHRFKYPFDRLFQVRDIIPDDELYNPHMADQQGEPCLVVIKRGITTGLTIGRANNIASYVRYYNADGSEVTSTEWPIFNYDDNHGPFSRCGDSGSAIVDSLGRLGGLLTGGGGLTDRTDITYATPVSFIFESLKAHNYHVT
ncbi:unnamed protein product, partial [Tuber aestivum]